MPSDGISGFGTTISVDATPIAEVSSISISGMSADDIDLTHHESPDGFREFVSGVVDGGTVDIELNYTKAQRAALMALWRDNETFVITYPDNSTDTFDGYINDFGQESPFDDKLSCTATFKISGKPTFVAAS